MTTRQPLNPEVQAREFAFSNRVDRLFAKLPTLARVIDLHRRDMAGNCKAGCLNPYGGTRWPCPTFEALENAAEHVDPSEHGEETTRG